MSKKITAALLTLCLVFALAPAAFAAPAVLEKGGSKIALSNFIGTVDLRIRDFYSEDITAYIVDGTETISFSDERDDHSFSAYRMNPDGSYGLLEGGFLYPGTVTLGETEYCDLESYEMLCANGEDFLEIFVIHKDNVPNALSIATPTASKVIVNQKNVSFDAYMIGDNNYFKLRDLATVVRGTSKQFEVSWDSENKAIDLVSGTPYTAIGGELAAGDGTAKTALRNTSPIYLDGELTWFKAYNINGNNYFKLRDVMSAFDIGVNWDGASNTITVDTSVEYVDP